MQFFLFSESQRRFVLLLTNRQHARPILSAHLFLHRCSESGGAVATCLASGATDGRVFLWDVTPLLQRALSVSTSSQTEEVIASGRHELSEFLSHSLRSASVLLSTTVAASVRAVLLSLSTSHQHELSSLSSSSPSQHSTSSAAYLAKARGDLLPLLDSELYDALSVIHLVIFFSQIAFFSFCQISQLSPLSTFRLHQSGVNGLSIGLAAASTPSQPRYLLASGGDDQALSLVTFSLEPHLNDRPASQHSSSTFQQALRVLGVRLQHAHVRASIFDSAHSSALKSVVVCGRGLLASCGYDQRLNVWTVDEPNDASATSSSTSASASSTPSASSVSAPSAASQSNSSLKLSLRSSTLLEVADVSSIDARWRSPSELELVSGGAGWQSVRVYVQESKNDLLHV